jgi:hypothetical protein
MGKSLPKKVCGKTTAGNLTSYNGFVNGVLSFLNNGNWQKGSQPTAAINYILLDEQFSKISLAMCMLCYALTSPFKRGDWQNVCCLYSPFVRECSGH